MDLAGDFVDFGDLGFIWLVMFVISVICVRFGCPFGHLFWAMLGIISRIGDIAKTMEDLASFQ